MTALALSLISVACAQTPGTADPSFTVAAGDASHFGVQPDGKVIYGSAYFLPITRVNVDGTPDTSFVPSTDNGSFLALQPDGKILTVIHNQPPELGSTIDTVLRLNADGSLDSSFTSYDAGHAVNLATVQPDGKILVSGYMYFRGSDTALTLTRLNADGSVDNGFSAGADGSPILYFSTSGFSTVTVQPDGKIIVTGPILGAYVTTPYPHQISVPIRRLNADGSVDTSFNYTGDDFTGEAVAIQPDGKILVGAQTYTDSTDPTLGVFRLNADGSADSSFTATTDQAPPTTYVSTVGSLVDALAIQPDGKVIVGGTFDHVDSVALSNLARLNADGSLDTTFAAANPVGSVGTLALQGDGKVVVGGGAGLARLYAYTPVTTSADTAAGIVGQPFTYQITANNAPASFTASPLPDGLSLDAATGLITGTPTQAATVRITLGTLDATGTLTGTGLLTLTVAPASPVITSATTAAGQVGSAFNYQITATNSPVSFTANPLPDGLNLDTSTGLITGTPTQAGTFSVTLGAVDGTGTNTSMGTGALTLTVAVLPPPVVSSATTANAQVGTAFSYQIAATNTPTSFAASGLPAGLSVDDMSGLITGTPTAAGSFSVALSATNSTGTGTAVLSLSVAAAPVIAPMVTSAVSAMVQEGQSFSYQITATNVPTSFAATGLPIGVTVSAATGLISGAPTVPGTYNVILSATNSGGTGTGAVTLTVAAPVVTLTTAIPEITVNGGQAYAFLLTLSSASTADIQVAYSAKGTATAGVDYVMLKGTAKVKAGKTTKVIKVTPEGDLNGASKKTIKLVLEPGTGYSVGTTGKVKVTILPAGE